mgnify:CR=1 FL=1
MVLLFAGAHREPSRGNFMSDERPIRNRVLAPSGQRSITSLLKNLSESELERLAVEIILQNRRYLQHAQALFDRLQAGVPDQAAEQDGEHLLHDYHLALINLNGHHEVVGTLIDALGYVPDVPGSGDPLANGRNWPR